MFIRHKNLTTQHGDTIVEVLICIAIVGVVLAGAFVVSNRSQHGVRDSQEHAEALKLTEGQLEQVRASAKDHNGEVFNTSSFCMVNVAPVVTSASNPASKCVVDSSGAPAATQPAYQIVITKTGDDTNGYIFTIQISWDSINGAGRAQETTRYRLYRS